MANKQFNGRFQFKHDIEANWGMAQGFIPLLDELIVYDPDDEHPHPRFKLGDGVTNVNLLPFVSNIEKGEGDNSIEQTQETASWTSVNPSVKEWIDNGTGTADDGHTIHSDGYSVEVGAFGKSSSALGGKSQALGKKSHAEGSKNIAFESNAHAEGNETFAAGKHSHSEGNTTAALGSASHSEGVSSVARGEASHAEGAATIADGQNSHAEGNVSHSVGFASHAEGNGATSEGAHSHAEGLNTTAKGEQSHAEGHTTRAEGTNAHTEGYGTQALQSNDHAEGAGSIAKGSASHAEGDSTEASGYAAHAGGISSKAQHVASFAQGNNLVTGRDGQAVVGQFNEVDINALFVVGGGTSDNDRKNIFTINGYDSGYRVFINGEPMVQNNNIADCAADGSVQQVNDYDSWAPDDSQVELIADADVQKNENGEVLSGAFGAFSSAFGGTSQATAKRAHAEGTTTVAAGKYSHTEGNGTYTKGNSAHAEGILTAAIGDNAHSEGDHTRANGNSSHAEGGSTTANGIHSHAEGANTQAIGDQAHAEGGSTTASGTNSHAEGSSTTASAAGAHAEGTSTVASGEYSHAEGNTTEARGYASHAGGSMSLAAHADSFVHGSGLVSGRDQQAVFGVFNEIDENALFAVGVGYSNDDRRTGFQVNMGGQVFVNGNELVNNNNVENGANTGAVSQKHNAESWTPDADQEEIKQSSANKVGTDLAVGAFGQYSFMEGGKSQAKGKRAHAEGTSTVAVGDYSHAEGNKTGSLGLNSHAEGLKSVAQGGVSHAEGGNTRAIGEASHTEGVDTIARSYASHAEGAITETKKDYSHAEGYTSKADGLASHAEGYGTMTGNDAAHAEGLGTRAMGAYAHAEGAHTEATGDNSHAEGVATKATAYAAHAGGDSTEANHSGSFAHGAVLKTGRDQQAVFGKFNEVDADALFVVGNGESADAPSNAFKVTSDGKAIAGGKQLATLDDINNAGGEVESNVFIAEYGTTTEAEIDAALNAGKACFCHISSYLYDDDNESPKYLTNAYVPVVYGPIPAPFVTFGAVVPAIDNRSGAATKEYMVNVTITCRVGNIWSINVQKVPTDNSFVVLPWEDVVDGASIELALENGAQNIAILYQHRLYQMIKCNPNSGPHGSFSFACIYQNTNDEVIYSEMLIGYHFDGTTIITDTKVILDDILSASNDYIDVELIDDDVYATMDTLTEEGKYRLYDGEFFYSVEVIHPEDSNSLTQIQYTTEESNNYYWRGGWRNNESSQWEFTDWLSPATYSDVLNKMDKFGEVVAEDGSTTIALNGETMFYNTGAGVTFGTLNEDGHELGCVYVDDYGTTTVAGTALYITNYDTEDTIVMQGDGISVYGHDTIKVTSGKGISLKQDDGNSWSVNSEGIVLNGNVYTEKDTACIDLSASSIVNIKSDGGSVDIGTANGATTIYGGSADAHTAEIHVYDDGIADVYANCSFEVYAGTEEDGMSTIAANTSAVYIDSAQVNITSKEGVNLYGDGDDGSMIEMSPGKVYIAGGDYVRIGGYEGQNGINMTEDGLFVKSATTVGLGAGSFASISLDSSGEVIINGSSVQIAGLADPSSPSDAVNKSYVDTKIGDIESVLDSIIAIQNSLIGGNA